MNETGAGNTRSRWNPPASRIRSEHRQRVERAGKKKLTAILVGMERPLRENAALDAIEQRRRGFQYPADDRQEYFASNLMMQENKRLY